MGAVLWAKVDQFLQEVNKCTEQEKTKDYMYNPIGI